MVVSVYEGRDGRVYPLHRRPGTARPVSDVIGHVHLMASALEVKATQHHSTGESPKLPGHQPPFLWRQVLHEPAEG